MNWCERNFKINGVGTDEDIKELVETGRIGKRAATTIVRETEEELLKLYIEEKIERRRKFKAKKKKEKWNIQKREQARLDETNRKERREKRQEKQRKENEAQARRRERQNTGRLLAQAAEALLASIGNEDKIDKEGDIMMKAGTGDEEKQDLDTPKENEEPRRRSTRRIRATRKAVGEKIKRMRREQIRQGKFANV